MPTATANGKRFTFPEGTTPEQMGQAIDEFFQQDTQGQRPVVTGGRGIGGQRAKQRRFDEAQALELSKQIEAGQLSARDLSSDQVEAVRKARINAIPELSGISDKINFGSAMAALTAFDPDEFGQILTNADPDIGVVTTPEGQKIAVNNRTGAVMNINKAGPSLVDALQFGGATAAFTPAGRATTIPRMIGAGMGTQALIEFGQKDAGGEINPGDVALAGAAPVALKAVTKVAGAGIRSLKNRSPAAIQMLDERLQGLPVDDSQVQDALPRNVSVKEGTKKATIRQAMKEGTKEAAGFKLNAKGQVVPDSVGREVVKQGFDPRTVSTIKFSNTSDKQAMLKMLDLAEESLKSGTARVRNRPQKIIGDTVMKRFKVIVKAKEKASKDVGEAVKKDLKGKVIDVTGEVDAFLDDLEALGIVPDGEVLNFSQSKVVGSATTPIKNVYKQLKNQDDGANLHQLKQFISEQIDFNKTNPKPLARRAESALKSLRSKINDRLRAESDDYAQANDVFSETIGAINDFGDVMGRRFDPDSSRVNDLVGQELRKVLSNFGVRNDMIAAIDKLDDVAIKHGGQFADDPLHQVVFYSDLEKLLGSFADNSLQGVTEKAIGVGVDVATGTPANTVGALAKTGVRKALGRSEEKALKSIRELLNRP